MCLHFRQEKFYEGHLLESETYVGGHVEALASGVFRSDLDMAFEIDAVKVEEILGEVDEIIKFTAEEEGKINLSEVSNFSQIKSDIEKKLRSLMETPKTLEKPLLYHVDVAAMYPNIILTNRLQPNAIVDDVKCASCIFNKEGKRWTKEEGEEKAFLSKEKGREGRKGTGNNCFTYGNS